MISRDDSLIIDYGKAIGIILVVMYHLKTNFFNVYHAYMFHMPLFFFIGGMLFKKSPVLRTIIKSTKKQFVYLLYTFVILALVGTIITKLFGIGTGNVYTGKLINSVILAFESNLSNNKLFIVAWFLLAYWLVSILFSVAYKSLQVFKNEKNKNFVIIVMGVILGYTAVNVFAENYHTYKSIPLLILSQVSFGMMFYSAGFVLKNKFLQHLNIYTFIIITGVLFILRNYGLATSTVMSWAGYRDGFYVSSFTAFSGIYAVFLISKLIASQGELKILKEIGKSSRAIMSYHVLCFVVLDILFSYVLSYKTSGTDAYMNHFYDKWTWPVYVAFGVIIPTSFSYLYRLIKNRTVMFRTPSRSTSYADKI
ncbi:acyltransferase family protein [Enterobacter wuhouensis]|uniref:acyltransferase family protein n=1 Tax=Enterobacter wuhouensis TaxID=2529381 RepID=UPI003D772E4E